MALLVRADHGWAPGRTAVLELSIRLWNVSLRQTVKKQTATIAEGITHESRLQKRQRIGRDLHDTLHQEFNGTGMLRVRMLLWGLKQGPHSAASRNRPHCATNDPLAGTKPREENGNLAKTLQVT